MYRHKIGNCCQRCWLDIRSWGMRCLVPKYTYIGMSLIDCALLLQLAGIADDHPTAESPPPVIINIGNHLLVRCLLFAAYFHPFRVWEKNDTNRSNEEGICRMDLKDSLKMKGLQNCNRGDLWRVVDFLVNMSISNGHNFGMIIHRWCNKKAQMRPWESLLM